MVEINEVTPILEKHLDSIDECLEHMIGANYNHVSIHEFRESIRRFRALIYFFIQNIRPSDYRMIEFVSKKYFNMTSLIREIDVFEIGYKAHMSHETLIRLSEIKSPLMEKLIEELDETNNFRFNQMKVHIRPIKSQPEADKCFHERQCELFKTFFEKDELKFNEEKYIHAKRMLAKKILYAHKILLPNEPSIESINMELEKFQQVAKQLHDVCVNLRFIGQYQLDDHNLISKLIHDHAEFTSGAEAQYEKTCNVISPLIYK